MAGTKGRRSWGWIRKSGRTTWHASYKGPDVLRHHAPKTFSAKMDAEHWLANERRLIEFGIWTPPAQREAEKLAGSITVAEYAATWIEQRPLKPRTKIGYEALLDSRIKGSVLEQVPLKNLTPDAVRSWHAGMSNEKPTARAHAYQLLHAVCATAVVDGLLPSNPCNIPKVMTPATKKQPVILTPPEIAALADAIPLPRFRALVLIAAWCGLRWGEVSELRRKDVSDDHSVITVARAVTHREGCRVDTTKSGKGRAVVVPPHIRGDLAAHLEQHVGDGAEALLFVPVRGGCHLNDKAFRDSYFIPALTKIGRDGQKKPRPTIHDLRHFAGTTTARVGNLVETMGRLGHSTVKASLLYQQIVSGRDAEVAEALSKLAENQEK